MSEISKGEVTIIFENEEQVFEIEDLDLEFLSISFETLNSIPKMLKHQKAQKVIKITYRLYRTQIRRDLHYTISKTPRIRSISSAKKSLGPLLYSWRFDAKCRGSLSSCLSRHRSRLYQFSSKQHNKP